MASIVRHAPRAAVCAAALALAPAATIIPANQVFLDATGKTAAVQAAGPVAIATQPFFQALGTNGRTCGTCHVAGTGYSITPAAAQSVFTTTGGTDPLFRKDDGSNCPLLDTSTVAARQSAYSMLLTKGLFRIVSTMPQLIPAQWRLVSFTDPYGCLADPVQGLTAYGPSVPTVGFFSHYRRPLPTANLPFEAAILSDGRAPSFVIQATNAEKGHEQTPNPPTALQLTAITGYETGIYAAQYVDSIAGPLAAAGGGGGPAPVMAQTFYPGINDPFGGNPNHIAFNPVSMTVFANWATSPTGTAAGARRAAIAAGETIFNQRTFNITGVRGLNDVMAQPVISGTCSTCHDSPNAGTHSLPLFVAQGTTDAAPPGLDVSGLPVYTYLCAAGPLAGQTFVTTDLGHGGVSGQCQDIGTTKILGLRNLASHPPYFHNGSAPGLTDVVNFYNQRFSIGLSATDQANLLAFLQAL